MNTAHRIPRGQYFFSDDGRGLAAGLANLKTDVSAAIRSATEIGLNAKYASVSNFVLNAKGILTSYDAIHNDIAQSRVVEVAG